MYQEEFVGPERVDPIFDSDQDIRAGWVNLYAVDSVYAPRTYVEAGRVRPSRDAAVVHCRDNFGRGPYARVRIIPKKGA